MTSGQDRPREVVAPSSATTGMGLGATPFSDLEQGLGWWPPGLVTLACGHVHGAIGRWEGPKPRPGQRWWCRTCVVPVDVAGQVEPTTH